MSLKKFWHFIWYDDSPLSWIVNIVIALVLVKFVIYPGLGLLFGTTHPLVAVVSSSMDHNGLNFNSWWEDNKAWYESNGITKEGFQQFYFKHGFNKGDIMLLVSAKSKKVGDVLVYRKPNSNDPPIIHRAVKLNQNSFQTKGDNVDRVQEFEQDISNNALIGKAVLRVPYLGYIKIVFVDLIWNPIIKIFK